MPGVLLHEQRDELADPARIELGVRLCDGGIDCVRGGIGELDAEPVLDLSQGLALRKFAHEKKNRENLDPCQLG